MDIKEMPREAIVEARNALAAECANMLETLDRAYLMPAFLKKRLRAKLWKKTEDLALVDQWLKETDNANNNS